MYYKLKDLALPLYYRSRKTGNLTNVDRTRIVDNLIRLRKHIAKELPSRSVKDSLMLATWNLRDFGGSRLNPSPRLTESLYYIAEIISAFDLVALQEINDDMYEFTKLMEVLGPSWKWIATDVAGNNERMTFVYDSGKVLFLNIAGEIVLGKKALTTSGDQFNRTPFLVKFQTGWLKFNLCTVHLFYGDDSGPGKAKRIEEIDRIAGFLADRAADDRKKNREENYVLLGDMNVVSPTDETMAPLLKHKFELPSDITKEAIPSNMGQNKYYDQIAFLRRKNELELCEPSGEKKCAGVFNYYDSVFRKDEFAAYFPIASNRDKVLTEGDNKGKKIWGDDDAAHETYFTKQWRTWQMSDHLPMWVQLKIDFTDSYLETLKNI
jgi:endonuclease/exonuclease/phosphatase family metal-dependent hydrolase